MGRITLREIADILGISIGTVDRAIHNRPDVSPRTRQMVLNAIEEYGYKTDKVARSLSLKPKKKRIGVISKEKPEFFWGTLNNGIKAAENELADHGVEIVFRTYRGNTQEDVIVRVIDELMESNVDAIALTPQNIKPIRDKINRAIGLGIKVVTFNDDLTDTERLFYVGPQAKQSGRIAGQLMGRFLKERGNVLTLNADVGSWEYQKRLEGFKEILKESFPNINTVADMTFQYIDNRLNESNIQCIFESMRSLDGIYDVDGATLYEVASIRKRIDKLDRCVMIGHEIWSNVSKLIDEGVITACISQDPFSQGYYVIRMLYDYLDEGKLPQYEKMYTRLDVIMKENLVNKENVINPFYSGLY